MYWRVLSDIERTKKKKKTVMESMNQQVGVLKHVTKKDLAPFVELQSVTAGVTPEMPNVWAFACGLNTRVHRYEVKEEASPTLRGYSMILHGLLNGFSQVTKNLQPSTMVFKVCWHQLWVPNLRFLSHTKYVLLFCAWNLSLVIKISEAAQVIFY